MTMREQNGPPALFTDVTDASGQAGDGYDCPWCRILLTPLPPEESFLVRAGEEAGRGRPPGAARSAAVRIAGTRVTAFPVLILTLLATLTLLAVR
ncbi:hypothetical protein [Streptomyces fructofermentans]|nr:hypothetical protein [Streptomyces fructofermentans]